MYPWTRSTPSRLHTAPARSPCLLYTSEIAGVSLLAAALAVLLYTAVRHDWPAWETPWTIGGALLLAVAGTAVLLAGYRCPYCGKGLKFGARYCTHCGSSLEDCGRIRRDHASVSYTHLDVYKRQDIWCGRFCVFR